MQCEVIVVGGGIGGLTTAALLAARGVDVCLFERQSRVGGCVANFEHLGYVFEPTAGLYSGWQSGGIYERLFSELRVAPPQVSRLCPSYVVRFPDHTDVSISENAAEFEVTLRTVFSECAEEAIKFYRMIADLELTDAANENIEPVGKLLARTSPKFRRFIDIQLQTFVQEVSDTCPLPMAARALSAPLQGRLWAIHGGGQALADILAFAFKANGGKLRLDSAVLRLAYGTDGAPIGVDLLTGERVVATRAIVSNLTIWDTYGKLIGPRRMPAGFNSKLKQLQSWGSYLLFAAIDEEAASRLKASRFLVLTEPNHDLEYAADEMQFVFSMADSADPGAPAGQRAVTICTFTRADEWFSFHEDETAHAAQDQTALESCWSRVHLAMPELGHGLEAIETLTPRTTYEMTRRRFGMTGRPSAGAGTLRTGAATIFPNLFMVGDTVTQGFGVEGITSDALALANELSHLLK